MSLITSSQNFDSRESHCAQPRALRNWLDGLEVSAKHQLRVADAAVELASDSSRNDRKSHKLKREREFAVGRDCAEQLLTTFGEQRHVGVNEDRSPAWPSGFVGSITHSNRWTWATVARQSDVRAIGVDTESVVDSETRQQIESEIATPREWDIATNLRLDPQQAFTVVFSAKEAFYKCWSPLTGNFFGFDDAEIESATPQRLRIRMTETNPNFGLSPNSLDVFFCVCESDVFTATWMVQS